MSSASLSASQRTQLARWREEASAENHLLGADRLRQIEHEISGWAPIRELSERSNFFERFSLLRAGGDRTSATTWRGLCHWLGLRHGSVQGLLFTPARLSILQRRADWIDDYPGHLDMTFAGHMGESGYEEAVASEARGETGLRLLAGSPHVLFVTDLEPICSYDYTEPARVDEEFYNVEVRYVFAIRISSEAVGTMRPLDREVSSFLLAPIDETRKLLQRDDVASALEVSGPMALAHASERWQW